MPLRPVVSFQRMESATIIRRRRGRALAVGAAALAIVLAYAPSAGAAKKKEGATNFRSGTYVGKTRQETVEAEFRTIELRVTKAGKVKLLTEPVVRFGFCTSVPVFTLDGAEPSKPLSRRGAFAFENTFLGTKVDKIRGQFVSDSRIEGFALYNFQGQSDLCGPGAVKVNFRASRQKK
jgi:hypothetical protein